MIVSASAAALLAACAPASPAQQPVQIVQAAVAAELAANVNDKSVWTFRDHNVTPGSDLVAQVVQTPAGTAQRTVMADGKPLVGAAREFESDRISRFVRDPSALNKQRKAAEHDDAQAAELTKMLPDAFLWTLKSETPEFATLEFRPNPGFSPPDMQSRVLGAMAGELIVARKGNRIRTLRGTLSYDVKIGFGILGKLNEGGTFDVERREVAPGFWEITETHVNIGGRALFFKSIGTQQDETKTDWKPSTAQNLQEAEELLRNAR